MSHVLFRLHLILHRLDDAIRHELSRHRPSGMRLLRLKKLKLVVQYRLATRFAATAPVAA